MIEEPFFLFAIAWPIMAAHSVECSFEFAHLNHLSVQGLVSVYFIEPASGSMRLPGTTTA
jgi:hypothetical protein